MSRFNRSFQRSRVVRRRVLIQQLKKPLFMAKPFYFLGDVGFEPIGIAARRVVASLEVRRQERKRAAENDNQPPEVARVLREGEAPALARTRAHRSTPKTTAAYAETAMASAERE